MRRKTDRTTRRRTSMTARGLMALVALVAIGLGAYSSRNHGSRRAYYLKRAEAYAARRVEFDGLAVEAGHRASTLLRRSEGVEGDDADRDRKRAEDELLRASLYRRVAEFDRTMEARYRAAADRPWAPPPPELSSPIRGLP